MTLHRTPHYLLATLGGKPQVIITALDMLRGRGLPVSGLVLFHTAQGSPRIAQALTAVTAEIAHYKYPAVELRSVPLSGPAGPLSDVVTAEEIDAGFRAIYRTMLACKLEGARLHLCPAGGRKTMILFSMAAAQLLFEEGDQFWHVVAEGDFLASGRLHPQAGDAAQLIAVPLLRWLNLTPALLHQEMSQDPYQLMQKSQVWLEQSRRQRLAEFWHYWLSRAERPVAELLIREGLDNRAIARRLGRSASTVANQLTSVYGKLAEFLDLPPGERANRHTLVATFAAYLDNPG